MISRRPYEGCISIIGASGKTGTLLVKRFLREGHAVRAISRTQLSISKTDNGESLTWISGDVTKDDPSPWMLGVDTAIFAAGGTSSTENAVDNLGAARCAMAAAEAGAEHFILISAHGAHEPDSWGEEFRSYLEAKAAGEKAVRETLPNAVILRPGILTDDPGTGTATIRTGTGPGDVPISRADVATIAVAISLEREAFSGATLEIVGGETDIYAALAQCLEELS